MAAAIVSALNDTNDGKAPAMGQSAAIPSANAAAAYRHILSMDARYRCDGVLTMRFVSLLCAAFTLTGLLFFCALLPVFARCRMKASQ